MDFKDVKIKAVGPHSLTSHHSVRPVLMLVVALFISLLTIQVHVLIRWPPQPAAPPAAIAAPSDLPLRCAIFNEWDYHFEVMTGLAAAFQAAGCDVDVFMRKDPDNITDSMAPWLKGLVVHTDAFVRHPATYSIIALTTFPSAKFEKYVSQISASPAFALSRQIFFAVVHNPDKLAENAETLHLVKALGSSLWLSALSPAVSAYTDALLQSKGLALGRKTDYIVPATPLTPVLSEAVARLSSGAAQPSSLCIQGIVDTSRRNYSEVFSVLEAVQGRMRQLNEHLLILGIRKDKVELPSRVAASVKRLGRLPYEEFDAVLATCRALFTSFASDVYLVKKASSTVATAVNLGVPLITDRRTLAAYSYLDPQAAFAYPSLSSQVSNLQAYQAAVAAALDAGQEQRRAMLRVKSQVMQRNEAVALAVLRAAGGRKP